MNAPKMSHTVGLLYPESAQLRAALGERKPGADNCWGLKSTNGESTAATVIPIIAIAAPGNGSRTRPTITPTKMEKKYHAWWGRPDGAGTKARTTAMAMGAIAFHAEADDFVVVRLGASERVASFRAMVGTCVFIVGPPQSLRSNHPVQ